MKILFRLLDDERMCEICGTQPQSFEAYAFERELLSEEGCSCCSSCGGHQFYRFEIWKLIKDKREIKWATARERRDANVRPMNN